MPDGAHNLSFRRAGPGTPRTLDRAARTVEVVAATASPVRRYGPNPSGSWEDWTEVLDPAGADLSRFKGGPLLLDHRNETGALVGSVQSARVVGGELIATIRFAGNERGEEALGLVEDGHLSGVSVGYVITRWRRDGDTYTATEWQPLELSLTPIPADPNARIRSAGPETRAPEEGEMPETTTTAPPEGVTTTTPAAADAVAILGLCRKHNLGMDFAEGLLARGSTLEAARTAVLDEIARRDPFEGRGTTPAEVGDSHDAGPGLRARCADALAALTAERIGLKYEPTSGREFLGGDAAEAKQAIAARALRAAGHRSDDGRTVRSWFGGRSGGLVTTSDYPLIAGAAAELVIARALEQAPIGLRQCVHEIAATDWRARKHWSLSGAATLADIGEGGQPPMLQLDENGEALPAPARQAGFFRAAEELLANAASSVALEVALARSFLEACNETLRATIAAKIATPGNLADGAGVFNATAGNEAETPALPTVQSLSVARTGLERMKDSQGTLRPVEASILLVAPEQRTAAEQLVETLAAAEVGEVNPFATRIRVVSDPGLSGAAGAHWFTLGDPSRFDGLALILADDTRSPRIESREAWTQFGMEWRVSWPMAAAWVRRSWFRTEIPA